MRTNNQYSIELKLQIVKEYLEENMSYRELAEKYNLASSTQVVTWVKQYKEFGEEYFKTEHRGRKKKNPKPNLESMTLEEQIEYLQLENCILKKAIALNLI